MTFIIPWAWFYVLGRVIGFVLLAPVWAWNVIPPWFIGVLALGLTVAVTPGIQAPTPASWLTLGIGFGGQLVVGIAMGLTLAVVLAGVEMAGTLVTNLLGIGLGASADPAVMVSGAGLSTIFGFLAMLAFVAGGGLLLSIQVMHDSFLALPVGQFPILSLAWLIGLGQTLFGTALLFGAPLLGAVLLVIFAIGVLNRAFPSMSAYFLALPTAILLVLVLFWIYLPDTPDLLNSLWTTAWSTLSHLLAQWSRVYGH